MKVALIISTYNAPRSLELTLVSLLGQIRKPDQVLIADDGSGDTTAKVIQSFQAAHPDIPVQHVWHEDRGFEKNTILNKAVLAASAEYLIFTDGDCLMHPSFIQRHVDLARAGRFVCGSLIRLGAKATASVTEDDVLTGRVFDRAWLRAQGTFDRLGTWLKSMPFPLGIMSLAEMLWPIRRSWMGSNSAVWRADAIAINGYDEEMKYGGGDKEFGIRLANHGVRPRSIRFTAPAVHLDHPRGYADPERMKFNRERIESSRRTGKTWVTSGAVKESSSHEHA